MYKIIGVKDKHIKFDDGRIINGFEVYVTDDSDDTVDGLRCERFFMSDRVCNRSNYNPVLGDCLDAICYNKFGKLDRVLPSGRD